MSFIKGFMSLFDWFSAPKSYDEFSQDLDNDMQKLYDKMGWGKYSNPLRETVIMGANGQLTTLDQDAKDSITICTSKQFLEEMLKLVPSGPFVPYAYYNEDMDSIQVYFKDENSYTQPLNKWLELHLSHDTDEVVGVNILNIRKVLKNDYK